MRRLGGYDACAPEGPPDVERFAGVRHGVGYGEGKVGGAPDFFFRISADSFWEVLFGNGGTQGGR